MSETPRGDAPLELWGGIECTVNRVGDAYFDQVERTGHARRPGDLERLAGLGIRTLRYPVLWERTAPDGLERADWAWADAQMARLRELGIRPIVGLVHHGSGPRRTSLVDPGFADELAAYARAVAARYPWVTDFSPVNEPLTTARFAGLYGHWHPHGRDFATFARALLIQCRAVVLAMRAIREVTPAARLIQTEDVGVTYSTRALAYQARHDNARRLLSLDLLSGRVRPDHPLWRDLRAAGAPERELRWFEACQPPDVIGLNYYVTSDRWLDERLERYPAWSHGGNLIEPYADVEAARVRAIGIAGHRAHLRALWARYRRPLAITEVQVAATREDQLRWLAEAWRAAGEARADGVDVRAVTAWALLGAYDWDALVVRAAGRYEVGALDVRGPEPRPTALAAMIRALAAGGTPDHPALSGPGWWRRPERVCYGPAQPPQAAPAGPKPPAGLPPGPPFAPPGDSTPPGPPILIAGAAGALGRHLARACEARGLVCRRLDRGAMDIADAGSVRRALARLEPWAVVNAAGYACVDGAQRDAGRCRRDNTLGAVVLATECRARDVRLLTFSSDLVFDGAQARPYVESDRVRPLSIYGASKADAERGVLALLDSALIVRAGPLFGVGGERDVLFAALCEITAGRRYRAPADAVVSPTYAPDLIHASLDLLIDGERGIWHLANRGAVSWAELVLRGAERAGVDVALVNACAAAELGRAAPRPAYRALGSERAALLPGLEQALDHYVSAAVRPPEEEPCESWSPEARVTSAAS